MLALPILPPILSYLPLFIVSVFLIFSTKYFVEYLNHRKVFNQLGGPRDIPFIGNLHQIPLNPTKLRGWLHNMAIEYGAQGFNAGRIWVGMLPYVGIFRGKDVENLIHSSKNISKMDVYLFMTDWLGTGLLTSTGAKWKSRRRLLTPSFHFDILSDFMVIFNEQARIFVDRVGAAGERPDDLAAMVTRCTLDIICESAMGVKMEIQSMKNTEYAKAVHRLSSIIIFRTRTPWIVSNLLYCVTPAYWMERRALSLVKRFTRQVIETRRAEMLRQGDDVTENRKRVAFLTTLLRAQMEKVEIPDDGIQEEVDTFMFEGHDTTSSGITWAIQMIGSHPDVRDKLHTEVDEIFGESDRDVTADDLNKLTYLSRVLKEVMRLCPPVPFIGRELSEDTEYDGVRLPKGTNILIFIYSLHRDDQQFPDPERFDPDRFLPENSEGRHPYAYIPFSAGPRNCIGQKFAQMEEKVVLSWLLRRYTWETSDTIETLAPTIDLILRPTKKLTVTIRPRH